MKKSVFNIVMALVLCLGLLPAEVRADGPGLIVWDSSIDRESTVMESQAEQG